MKGYSKFRLPKNPNNLEPVTSAEGGATLLQSNTLQHVDNINITEDGLGNVTAIDVAAALDAKVLEEQAELISELIINEVVAEEPGRIQSSSIKRRLLTILILNSTKLLNNSWLHIQDLISSGIK